MATRYTRNLPKERNWQELEKAAKNFSTKCKMDSDGRYVVSLLDTRPPPLPTRNLAEKRVKKLYFPKKKNLEAYEGFFQ
ncbi:hypothetical protein TNIN_140611 [Trichonephila inaurata madagascariensis]|uniref:Uncharacterized protein n=1 Tax=Trichonephila inaurata madagascariensis TaxID=2747483 RepID=A0A8X6Y782_9ARAC|nr:hypothetical protein TNIN_140611 [Trichonephila inaurata madagascariensis]